MTAEELARELGPETTGNAITKLERGHRAQVSPSMVVDLARAFGISPLALLFPLDEPDAEIVVLGMRGTVRSFGAWLLGEFPHADIVTQTFRQLVAADRAVGAAAEAEQQASATDRESARQRLEDEITLRGVLEAHLSRLHDALFSGEERGRLETDDGLDQTAP